MDTPTPSLNPAAAPGVFVAKAWRISRLAGAIAIVVGVGVLVGWALDIEVLKSVTGTLTMKPNAAVGLVLAGLSLLFLRHRGISALQRRLAIASAAAVALLGVLTLLQHVAGWNLGIDELLFREPAGALATASPGRMGLPASTCFGFLGIALVLAYRRRAIAVAQSMAFLVVLWSLLALMGYFYGAVSLYTVTQATAIALHTAMTLFLLGAGLLGALAGDGIVAAISSDSDGGSMARRAMLAAIVAPIVLGWVSVELQGKGYFDHAFGDAMLIVAIVVIVTLVIGHGAVQLDRESRHRRLAEATIGRQEDRLRQLTTLIDLSHDPICVWEIDGGIVEWNAGCEMLYGYSRQEVLGRSSDLLLNGAAADPDTRTGPLREQLEHDMFWSGEVRHITRDGRTVTVESRQQLMVADGRRLVLETNRDITGRKQIEQALRRAHDRFALAESASNGFVYDWNVETGAVERSGGFASVVGYAPEETVATHDWWRALVHPEDLARILDGFDWSSDGWSDEYRVRHRSGHYIHVWDRGRMMRDESGRVTRVVGSTVDITDRKLLEQEREELLRREQRARIAAEESARLKDEFLATVSHELRTPLNAILGWVTLLRMDEADRAIIDGALETIERNARIQAELVNDILDVSRIVAGKLQIDRRPLQLGAIVRSAIETIVPAAEAKQLRLDVDLDVEGLALAGDADRLRQVVWNLLANAVKFTPTGGTVRVALERGAAHARIVVADSGCGIAPDFLPFVFERFLQADGSRTRRHGGLGLGLSIARYLVELHGGTIEAASDGVDCGATFTVELPLAETADEPHPSHNGMVDDASVRATANAGADLDGVSVLVVDDEPDAREVLRGILEHHGATVSLAAGAGEAMVALVRSQPRVIICDIGMPEEDGYSLIRRVRSLGAGRGGDVAAIALTGYARSEERTRALEAGFHHFLAKPVDAGALVGAIAVVLENRGAEA